MDILENIGEKLENIWKIFDSALKGIEGDPVKRVKPVVKPTSPSLLCEDRGNKGSQKHPSSQRLTGDIPSGQVRLNIFPAIPGLPGIVLPQHPVPRDDIEDYVWAWARQSGEGYLCERCGVAQVGAVTCSCYLHQPQSKRWDLKQLIKSMLKRKTEQPDTEQRQKLTGDDEGPIIYPISEEDMKKALRKVVKKKMTRHEACKLYGIPYQAFLEYEGRLVADGNNSSNLKRKSSNILYDRNDKKQNCVQTETSKVDAGSGEWARMLMEELEDTVWLRPVKRIKLERTKLFINQ